MSDQPSQADLTARTGIDTSVPYSARPPWRIQPARPLSVEGAGDRGPVERTTSALGEAWSTCPVAWMLAALGVPDLDLGYTLTPEPPRQPTALRLSAGDGSLAEIVVGDGERPMHETGPTRVWRVVENAYEHSRALGQPGWERLGLTVTPHRTDHVAGQAGLTAPVGAMTPTQT